MTEEAEYKWVGSHAQDLHDGRMLAPGETVTLSEDELREEHNESLIADGGLIATDEKGEHQVSLAQRRVKAREEKAQEDQPALVGDVVPEPEPYVPPRQTRSSSSRNSGEEE